MGFELSEENKRQSQQSEAQRERFIEAFASCGANVTMACEQVGIAIKRYSKWRMKYPEFKRRTDDLRKAFNERVKIAALAETEKLKVVRNLEMVNLQAMFLDEYRRNECNISEACSKIGIKRQRVMGWKKDPGFIVRMQEIHQDLCDAKEGQLMKAINWLDTDDAKARNTGLQALRIWLENNHPTYAWKKSKIGGVGEIHHHNIQNILVGVERKQLNEIARRMSESIENTGNYIPRGGTRLISAPDDNNDGDDNE